MSKAEPGTEASRRFPEGSPEAIPEVYERAAASWDRGRTRVLFERPWLERFRAMVAPGSSVLDLGCGSGEPIGRWLIEAGYRVTGVDVAAAMLAICRRRWPEGEWIRADMRGLDLGRRFGGIVAWDSFFHLTGAEQRAMFPIFARHLAKGGAGSVAGQGRRRNLRRIFAAFAKCWRSGAETIRMRRKSRTGGKFGRNRGTRQMGTSR